MKIKEVSYQRLFTIGNYNNERIGFIAEVEEGENPDLVAGNLYLKVCNIENCLETYRRLLRTEEYALQQLQTYDHKLEHQREQMKEMKTTIKELAEQIKSGAAKARDRMKHACSLESYEDLVEEHKKTKAKRKEWLKTVQDVKKTKQSLEKRIKEGNFSTKGLNIPQQPKHELW